MEAERKKADSELNRRLAEQNTLLKAGFQKEATAKQAQIDALRNQFNTYAPVNNYH